MRITFPGVGEAFDARLANTCLLLEGADESSLLLDCGFTAAAAFWQHAADPLKLDAVCLSHFHGDHWFGLPWLLVRSIEEGRTANLTIIGQEGVEERVRTLMDMAYPGTLDRAGFAVRFLTSAPDRMLDVAGTRLRFAASDHSVPCLAVRVRQDDTDVFFSGDGNPTPQTEALARGCAVVVHEAYAMDAASPGHGTVERAVQLARNAGAETLALVHVQRTLRHEQMERLNEYVQDISDLRVLLPEPGEVLLVDV